MFLLAVMVALLSARCHATCDCGDTSCPNVTTIDYDNTYPRMFVTCLPDTPVNRLIDNYCFTAFLLSTSPPTIQEFQARVFRDGRVMVSSTVVSPAVNGIYTEASPDTTDTVEVIGRVGCCTDVKLRCGVCGDPYTPYIYGSSSCYCPITPGCLEEVKALAGQQGVSAQNLIPLPMKLPSKCVYKRQKYLLPPQNCPCCCC